MRGLGVARDNARVSAILPVNLDDLLDCRGVESARVEFKSGWEPASDVKPHSAPDGPRGTAKYWIRLGAETVDAQANGLLSQLMAQTARVPWDDRRAFDARIEDQEGFRSCAVAFVDDYAELKLAERRLTGVAKIFEAMASNGLPPPRFDFDDERTWFRTTLPVHPGQSAAL